MTNFVQIPKTKKITSQDTFLSLGQEIAQTSKEETYTKLEAELNIVNETFIVIGGRLAMIKANEWYVDEGYSSIKEFVEQKYNLDYRRAMYWIKIYNTMMNSGVSFDDVKSMGWSKLRELCSVEGLLTTDNAKEWVELSNVTNYNDFKDAVRKAKKEWALENGKEVDVRPTAIKFNVGDDAKGVIQDALTQIKAENHLDPDNDAMALEIMARQAAAAGGAPYEFDLTKEERGELDYNDPANQVEVSRNDKAKIRSFMFTPEQETLVYRAIDMARNDSTNGEDTDTLALICAEYIDAKVSPPKVEVIEKEAPAPSLEEVMSKAEWETVLEVFDKLWPSIDITIDC